VRAAGIGRGSARTQGGPGWTWSLTRGRRRVLAPFVAFFLIFLVALFILLYFPLFPLCPVLLLFPVLLPNFHSLANLLLTPPGEGGNGT
jgi:hypothetical protein